MEQLTKRIIAIVLIAVIGVGIGVGAWFLLAEEEVGGYKTPGAPSGVPDDHIIKIGHLGDTGDITGEGAYQGAYLAIKQINELGGVVLTGDPDHYYFGIISENTNEAAPYLDVTEGDLAAQKMMTQHDPDFVIGGFRTEAVMTYRERVMDEHKIFINIGAATDSFCASVGSDYNRYKYCFRTMPINSSSLAKEIVEFYALALKPAMEAALGVTVDKVAIIREDLEWTVPMAYILKGIYVPYGYWGLNYNPWFNFTIVDEIAYPITATSTDFTGYINQFTSSGAQVVCPIISAQGGIKMMTQYNSLQPDYMIVGIDVMSQLGDDPDDKTGYWYNTEGGCIYEIIMQSTTRKNKTTQTVAMWDAYRDLWNKDPLYTAVGAHGAINMIAWAINATGTLYSDSIVAQLETITKTNTMEGAGGNIGFNQYHDLIEGYNAITGKIYSVTLWVQWQAGGTKSVVTSGGHIYPEWIVDTPIEVPPWM
ncbi:MAG: ABC transporter substrate-binding protein [Promethearchaeota archaeon]